MLVDVPPALPAGFVVRLIEGMVEDVPLAVPPPTVIVTVTVSTIPLTFLAVVVVVLLDIVDVAPLVPLPLAFELPSDEEIVLLVALVVLALNLLELTPTVVIVLEVADVLVLLVVPENNDDVVVRLVVELVEGVRNMGELVRDELLEEIADRVVGWVVLEVVALEVLVASVWSSEVVDVVEVGAAEISVTVTVTVLKIVRESSTIDIKIDVNVDTNVCTLEAVSLLPGGELDERTLYVEVVLNSFGDVVKTLELTVPGVFAVVVDEVEVVLMVDDVD